MVFLYRENLALAMFMEAWAATSRDTQESADLLSRAQLYRDEATAIAAATNALLWNDTLGYYTAFNTTSNSTIFNRVFLLAFPVWGEIADDRQTGLALTALSAPDMLSSFGVRSTSSLDARYVVCRGWTHIIVLNFLFHCKCDDICFIYCSLLSALHVLTVFLCVRYTNENVIFPYSNWRGPVWALPNALLSYAYADAAQRFAGR